jgi:hypothetical protein
MKSQLSLHNNCKNKNKQTLPVAGGAAGWTCAAENRGKKIQYKINNKML